MKRMMMIQEGALLLPTAPPPLSCILTAWAAPLSSCALPHPPHRGPHPRYAPAFIVPNSIVQHESMDSLSTRQLGLET